MALAPEEDLAIRDLYARYNHAIHVGDATAWAACFTPDGTFSNSRTVVTGMPQLVAYAEGWIREGKTRYWVENLVLEETPAGVRGICYVMILRIGADGVLPSIDLTGRYADELEHTANGWRFSRRHIARDG